MFESGIEDQPRAVDTREVYNYIRALQKGMDLLETIPISNQLIHSLHGSLLRGLPKHRSGHFVPGEYRKEQNFIGKSKDIARSRFNPPPPPIHLDCMSSLEKFINIDDMSNIPALIFIAIIHYQFETIHPFPDGNGRVGRLLIPIILKSRGIMDQPMLYMSQYFEDNKDEYVDLLLRVSQQSDWLSWIEFFLRGAIESSEKTIETIHKVRELQENYKSRVQQARSSVLLMQIIDSLFERIAITIPKVRDMTGTSYTAAQNNVNKLVDYGIVTARPWPIRPKFYFATELVEIFEE